MSRLHLENRLCIFTGGCASTQLNFNTLDIAEGIEPVYTRQVLANFSKIIDAPLAILRSSISPTEQYKLRILSRPA